MERIFKIDKGELIYHYETDKGELIHHFPYRKYLTITNNILEVVVVEKIQIKYHTDIDKIEQKLGGDWIDLRSACDIELWPGDFKLIPLGVSMKLPRGYEAHIAPRSSTFKNYGIIMTNSVGVVDNSYCGDDDEWMIPVYATKHTTIHKNDRICQFRIMHNQPKIHFEEVKNLGGQSRSGFGSTGVK